MSTDDAARQTLQRADQELQRRGLPSEVDARLRGRLGLEGSRHSTSRFFAGRLPWAVGALAAVASVTLVIGVLSTRSQPLGGFSRVELAAGAKVALTAESAVELVAGDAATLSSEPERFTVTLLSRSARVHKEPAGARVLQGTVEVRVSKRLVGEPSTEIAVSGGKIEVVGTRFTIIESGASGTVRLHEGAIVFHAPDGRVRSLASGEELVWPLPAEQEASNSGSSPVPDAQTPSSKRPTPRISPSGARSRPGGVSQEPAPEVFSRVLALRSRGRYAEAAKLLEDALASERGPAAREVLIWELTSISAEHLHDRDRGCRHAQAYLREFPAGRFAERTHEAQRSLGCETEPTR